MYTLGAVSGIIEEFETSTEQYENVFIRVSFLLKIYRIDLTANSNITY